MGNVLYEFAPKFEISFLIPIAMFIIIPIFFLMFRRTYKSRAVLLFCLSAFIFVTLALVFSLSNYINTHNKTMEAYESGEYETVEGYVEDYYYGRDGERFKIDGVEFSYNDFRVQPGYNNTKAYGGVINGDGQHLKIGYVFVENYGNIIVYIEELPGE